MAGTPVLSQDALVSAFDELKIAVQSLVSHNGDKDGFMDKSQRFKVIEAAHAILNAVETHQDMWRGMGLNLSQYSSAQLFYEWKAFDALPLQGGISFADLAAATGVEEALIRRAGAPLVATGLLKEMGPDHVACTYRSLAYRSDNPTRHALNMTWYQGFVPLSRYPDYFRTYGPKEPQTTNHVPITFAAGKPELGFFDMLAQDPDSLARFADAMASGAALFPIIGVYDFSWLIDQVKMSPGSERAIFVDVGGGVGHAIKAIHGAYPQLPIGRFVLQDTPETLAFGTDDTALAGIQRVPINFHKEAPVKGAYTYWLRWCLHDYGDKACENILRLVASSMAKDSRLLIQEYVLQKPRSTMDALNDWMVLAVGGKERDLDMWHWLVGTAGLKITHVAEPKKSSQNDPHACFVIECVLI